MTTNEEWRNEVYSKYPTLKVEEMQRLQDDIMAAKKLLERAKNVANREWKEAFAERVESAWKLLASLNLEGGE